MQFLWKYIDDLVGKGLELSILSELLFYASATFVPMALPLAILLSSLMTFGNMGENYELVALKSAGISLQRAMLPLIIVSIFISISAFFFSNNVLPIANLKFGTLLHDIRSQRPELNIRPGIFYDKIDNYIIKVSSKNKRTNTLYNVMIYDHTDNSGNRNVTIADSADMLMSADKNFLVLNLYNGCKYEELPEDGRNRNNYRTYPHQSSFFISESITLDLSGFGLKRTDEELFKENQEMLNVAQLSASKDSLIVEFEERKQSFGTNLLQTNYYKREIKPDSIYQDSCELYHYNVDSFFNALTRSEKLRIIESAQNFARSTQTYISATNMDYEHRERWITKYDIEWHRKFSLSFACLVLFFIGAPLGAIIRKGGLGMPVVVATLFFIFYYIISITGEKTVKQGLIPAYQGMWLSAAVLMPLGIFLTFKATADSVLFDLDAYKNVIKKLLGIKEKRARKLIKISDSRNTDKDYSDLHIVDNMKELSEMCSFYINNHLKMGFFQAIIHLVSFKNKEGIDKIRTGYNYLIFYMLEKSKNSNYYKNKLQEIPFDINIKSHRSVLHFVKLILLIPAFPLVVIFHIIEMYQLKRKLKQIIVITDDLVNIVDNPELLELKRN